MIKDILVNLNVGAEANWASDYAISVAAALKPRLGEGRVTVAAAHFAGPAAFR